VSGSVATLLTAGTCTIQAVQASHTQYGPASLFVASASQVQTSKPSTSQRCPTRL
jgi:hypothetical protein